jgi:hypothetical protein
MFDVRVICVMGKHGQLGLKGCVPWEENSGAIRPLEFGIARTKFEAVGPFGAGFGHLG